MNKWLVVIAFSVLLLVPVGAQDAFAGVNAVEIDEFPCTRAEVTVTDPSGASEVVELRGPTTIEVRFEGPTEGEAQDDNSNNLDEVPIEIVSMELVGTSTTLGPIKITQSSSLQSLGELEETSDSTTGTLDVPPFGPGTATSFFDVFFDIEIVALGLTFHNPSNQPLQLGGEITNKPPAVGEALEATNRVPLEDPSDEPTGFEVGPVTHIPNPPNGDGCNGEVVGGEFLPVDTTALLVAAAQSPAVWLTSITFAVIGVSAFLITRNPNNIRNIKAILQDYLDRF